MHLPDKHLYDSLTVEQRRIPADSITSMKEDYSETLSKTMRITRSPALAVAGIVSDHQSLIRVKPSITRYRGRLAISSKYFANAIIPPEACCQSKFSFGAW